MADLEIASRLKRLQRGCAGVFSWTYNGKAEVIETCLVSYETGKVPASTNLGGNPVYQDVAVKAMLEFLPKQDGFRNPSKL